MHTGSMCIEPGYDLIALQVDGSSSDRDEQESGKALHVLRWRLGVPDGTPVKRRGAAASKENRTQNPNQTERRKPQ
jgi:hypothetical protein